MKVSKDAMIALVFFILSVILISQAAITIQTYRSSKKTPDTNYWWSVFVLVISIIGLLASAGMGVYSQRNVNVKVNMPTAMAGSVVPQPMMMVPVPAPIKAN
jgi:surface polysaccharide O-acyltransferase-like enzyme